MTLGSNPSQSPTSEDARLGTPGQARPGSALITGAGKRLGRAIARALAQDGWPVAIHYRSSEQDAQELAAQIVAAGGRACTLSADLSVAFTPEAADRWLNQVAQSIGPVALLVNNASVFRFDLASNCSAQDLAEHYQANLIAPVLLTQALYRHVQKQAQTDKTVLPAGVAINLLDQKLANPNPDFFSYTLSKAALSEATGLMARSLAPWLRVLGVSPGFTMIAEGQSEEGFAQAHKVSPLGASSRPEEIANAVCWLATARAVTGTTLLVDGGQHLIPSSRDLQFTQP